MQGQLRLEYVLTRDDLFAFHWRAAYDSRLARRARVGTYATVVLLMFLMTFAPSLFSGARAFSLISIAGFLVGSLGAVGAGWWLQKRLATKVITQSVDKEKPEGGLVGRHTLVIDSTGITETTAVGESHTSWRGFDRIEQNSDYIFIYTTPTAAHVVPRRALASEDHAAEVITMVTAGIATVA